MFAGLDEAPDIQGVNPKKGPGLNKQQVVMGYERWGKSVGS